MDSQLWGPRPRGTLLPVGTPNYGELHEWRPPTNGCPTTGTPPTTTTPNHDDPQPRRPLTTRTSDHGEPPNHTDPQPRGCRPWGAPLTTETPNHGDSPTLWDPPALTQLLQDPPAPLGAVPRPPPADHRTALPGLCGAARGRSGAVRGGGGAEPRGWVCSGDFGAGGRCVYIHVCVCVCVWSRMHVCACTYMCVRVYACIACPCSRPPPHPAPSRGEQTALCDRPPPNPPRYSPRVTRREGMRGGAGGNGGVQRCYSAPCLR